MDKHLSLIVIISKYCLVTLFFDLFLIVDMNFLSHDHRGVRSVVLRSDHTSTTS